MYGRILKILYNTIKTLKYRNEVNLEHKFKDRSIWGLSNAIFSWN